MLAASAWASALPPAEFDRVVAETVVRTHPAGGLVCRKGETVDHWVGVVDGLVKMANVSVEGKPMSFTGIGTGAPGTRGTTPPSKVTWPPHPSGR